MKSRDVRARQQTKIYLQPPKGPKHDRSKQGKKGEFARLSSVLSQQSGTHEKESARATRAKGSKPAPKRLAKPCASPLHPRETQSTPAESGWTQSVREELQGDDSALSALAVMESFDEGGAIFARPTVFAWHLPR